MKTAIAIFLLILTAFANAGEWGVQYHLMSKTFESREYAGWNESTDGFAIRYVFNPTWAVQAGHYRNEFTVRNYNFFTNYVGADYTPLSLGPVRLGGYVWLTSGYNEYTLAPNPSTVTSERDSGILPASGLVARVEYKQFNYTMRVHPDLPGGVPAMIMSEIGWRFK